MTAGRTWPAAPAGGIAPALGIVAALLVLAACNRNTAPGNDREAQIDSAPMPAPLADARSALAGIAPDAVQVETMTEADLTRIGGSRGKCLFRLTRVGLPAFVHSGLSHAGVIKLNDRLIELRASRPGLFADGALQVVIRPVDATFDSRTMREADMIVMLPGAKDERGYRGFEDCSRRDR